MPAYTTFDPDPTTLALMRSLIVILRATGLPDNVIRRKLLNHLWVALPEETSDERAIETIVAYWQRAIDWAIVEP